MFHLKERDTTVRTEFSSLGKFKEIKVGTWIIGIMFLVMFFVTR